MRRGVWVVLGLVGLAPVGALAEEARRQPAEQAQGGPQAQGQEASPEVLQQQISELWQDVRVLHQEVASLREQSGGTAAAPAVGGAGQQGTAPANASGGPATDDIAVYGPMGSDAGGAGSAGGGATTVTAEQAGTALAEDADTSGIIVEIPRGGVRFPGIEGARRSQVNEPGTATGGSGRTESASPWSNVPNEEVFVGTLRSATRERLLMVGPEGRVYEFGMGERTRVLDLNGAAMSLQALREGTPVRTVTRPGALENQVITLQALGQAPAPSR
ncbi:hypothetical protein [Hyalangium gracile]|uniref:hypothetical protein n=1 Tax=Hyalangium gracile TaxID=394092 RepID=UPI001CCE9085|nr:hypothetical protein [Hyalangium gracile]